MSRFDGRPVGSMATRQPEELAEGPPYGPSGGRGPVAGGPVGGAMGGNDPEPPSFPGPMVISGLDSGTAARWAGTSTGGTREGIRESEPVQAGRSARLTMAAKMSTRP